jgi:hypothetical protein
MKVWNNCSLTEDEPMADHRATAFDIYRSQLTMVKENVWYDRETDECFGLDYNYTNRPDLAAVLTSRGRFVQSDRWGEGYVSTIYNSVFNSTIECSDEMILINPHLLEQFEGKTILIIGAGPTAKEFDWEEEEYDTIWTCNHFFKFDRLVERNDISLISLGNEVDLTKSNNTLHSYMRKNGDTLFAFDCGVTRHFMHMYNFNDQYYGRGLCYHPRFFGKVGTLTRLICLAIAAKAKKIKFVGMDGDPLMGERLHVFEPGKPLDKPTDNSSGYKKSKQQYVMFWDYVLNTLNPNIEFENLGEFHLSNLTADISKQEFETHNKRVIENV